MKKLKLLSVLVAVAICLTACVKKPEPEPSPYIQIPCGDEVLSIIPQEGAEKSDFDFMNFVMDGQRRIYTGHDYTTSFGIDVSAHQGDIDWDKVAQSGVEYVYIRCGYRGYTVGGLNKDKRFDEYIAGAKNAGLKVGVYFFSQATTAEEARREAEYTLEILDGTDLDLPVMYDWERMYEEDSRTVSVPLDELTEWCIAFTEVIQNRGYKAGIYTNRKIAYEGLDIKRLQERNLTFWVAQYDSWPDFYYKHTIWQYSFKGEIDGINRTVDLNLTFTPLYR